MLISLLPCWSFRSRPGRRRPALRPYLRLKRIDQVLLGHASLHREARRPGALLQLLLRERLECFSLLLLLSTSRAALHSATEQEAGPNRARAKYERVLAGFTCRARHTLAQAARAAVSTAVALERE